ncbi:MAG: hypothetical protein AAGF12_33230 [Myxococcota bacterium]
MRWSTHLLVLALVALMASSADAQIPPNVRLGIERFEGDARTAREVRRSLRQSLAWIHDVRLDFRQPEVNLSGEVRGDAEDRRVLLSMTSAEGALLFEREFPWGGAADANRVADVLVYELTGRPGPFSTQLLFARREGRGQKAIFMSQWDGTALSQVSPSDEIAMLPSFVFGEVWYSVMQTNGLMSVTRAGEPVFSSRSGLNMGVQQCGERLLFTSSRSGDPEVYSAAADGSDLLRLTHHAAIDVSAACGPNEKVAFVSDRSGIPQLYMLDTPDAEPRQLTFGRRQSQTPVFCSDGERDLLAYTQVGRRMRVVVRNLRSGQETTISPGWGSFKDPAFSPDCRLLAYVAVGRGVFVSKVDQPRRRRQVLRGAAETIRWGP